MKLPLVPLLVSPLLLHPQTGSVTDDRQEDRAAIRAHIDGIFQAYIGNDLDAIRESRPADWCGFRRGSPSIVRDRDAYMASLPPPAVSARMTGYRMIEFEVKFQGDVAIVPYVAELDLTRADQQFKGKLRVLDIYARDAHGWTQVAAHTSTHPESVAEEQAWPQPMRPSDRAAILAVREAVAVALRDDDAESVERLIGPDASFASGWTGFLPRPPAPAPAASKPSGNAPIEMDRYGELAVVRTVSERGPVTELFARRDGTWIYLGWHMTSDSTSTSPPGGITRINRFEAKVGQADALADLLTSTLPVIRSSEGCRRCQLLREQGSPERMLVVEVWDSREAHAASLSNMPVERMQEAMQLLETAPSGTFYAE